MIEFYGEKLELNPDGPGDYAVMEFAELMSEGADADGMEGMAVLQRLIVSGLRSDDGITDEDNPRKNRASSVQRYRRLCRKNQPKATDLQPLLKAIFEGDVEHPTGLPSDSTDGQEKTPLKSVPNSDANLFMLAGGRIDKYAMLKEAQEKVAV